MSEQRCKSDGNLFQAAGPEKLNPRSPNLVLVQRLTYLAVSPLSRALHTNGSEKLVIFLHISLKDDTRYAHNYCVGLILLGHCTWSVNNVTVERPV